MKKNLKIIALLLFINSGAFAQKEQIKEALSLYDKGKSQESLAIFDLLREGKTLGKEEKKAVKKVAVDLLTKLKKEKLFIMKKQFITFLVLVATVFSVNAQVTVSGVKVDGKMSLEGESLVLNGAGIREKMWIDLGFEVGKFGIDLLLLEFKPYFFV